MLECFKFQWYITVIVPSYCYGHSYIHYNLGNIELFIKEGLSCRRIELREETRGIVGLSWLISIQAF